MIELLNIDCIEYMKTIPDKFFELAIVDPPYGIDILHQGGFPDEQNFIKWERKDWDKKRPDEEYFKELKRVSKNYMVWGGNYFCMELGNSDCVVIWDKMQRDFSKSDFECCFTSFSSANRAFNMSRVQAYTNQDKIHPTQKPAKLYKWLLKNYAKEGDKIFDSHLGSGSIAIACHDMKFDLVGCEIDKDYYDAAVKRFENHKKQLTIF